MIIGKATISTQLAVKAGQDKASAPLDQLLPPYLHLYRSVFKKHKADQMPDQRPWDHAIDLKLDAPDTIRSKVYPMSVNEQGELDKFLDEQLHKGYIRPSKSPISSPVFFIKKKDRSLQLCRDH